MIDASKIGQYIQELRKHKNLTQNQISERLTISPQAVSKWERGESLPDISLLIDLAQILETTVDNILNGGETIIKYNKKMKVADIRQGIENLKNLGNLIGKTNSFYLGIIEGLNHKMNIDFEEYMNDSYKKEAMIAELIIQNMQDGVYIDLSDIKFNLEHEHWINVVTSYAHKFGIK